MVGMKFSLTLSLVFFTVALAVSGASGDVPSVGNIATMARSGDRAGVSSNAAHRAEVQEKLQKAWTEEAAAEGAIPLEEVTFPLVTFPDGSVRVQFKAATAILPQDEKAYVRGQGVLMEMFEEGGVFSGFFKTDNCIFDRATRTAYCDGIVRVQYKNIKITGTNMVCDLETRDIKILSGAQVTVNRFMENIGRVFKK